MPSQIHQLRIDVDRPGFSFNPTNCSPLEVTGALTGWNPAARPKAASRSTRRSTSPTARRCRSNRAVGRARTQRQPHRRHGPRRQAQSGQRRSQHPQDEARLPDDDPVAPDDDPESLRRPHLQRQPGELPRRLRDRHRDREHAGAEIAARRPGLPRLARERVLPGRRVRAAGRRHQARARRQDGHQKRHHELELRIRPRRAGRNASKSNCRAARTPPSAASATCAPRRRTCRPNSSGRTAPR